MNYNQSNILVTVTGPSLTGKTTFARLIEPFGYEEIVSTTTRPPREGEVHGKHYHFVTTDEFNSMLKKNLMIEKVQVGNNLYGISKDSIKNKTNIISISRSKISDFEKNFDKVYVINITLNDTELKRRLIKRGRENIKEIEKRLERKYDKIEARNLIVFQNDKSFDDSVKAFIDTLKEIDAI